MIPSDNSYLHAYGIAPMDPTKDDTVPLWQYARALDECNRLMYDLKRERFRNYRTPCMWLAWALGIAVLALVADAVARLWN